MNGLILRGGAVGVLGAVLLAGCGSPDSPRREDGTTMMRDEASADRMFEEMRWRNRILVVAADRRDEAIDRQLVAIATHSAGWSERDLVTIVLLPDRGYVARDPSGGLAEAETVSSDVAASMRRRFGIDGDGFAAALVGKDGGVKARYESVVAPEAVFPFIDAMPMRIDEMGQRP
ncbi:MAG: DUF4174 domain-containing protein [Phycisphaeraceae bacterium]|nr:DUF4174 domain-containing protein [Phycisphaeraceae bacterium]